MPYLSVQDIGKIAQRIIAAYRKLPMLAGQPVNKIQPELLVQELLGLSVQYHALSPSGRILGLTACGEVGVPIFDDPEHPEYYYLDGKTVLIDCCLITESANKGRYHFTLVHEACHQVYRMLFPKEYREAVALRQIHYCRAVPNADDDYWEEWRANILTSLLLMPEDMVRSNLITFGLGGQIRMLNRVFARDAYERFSEMADYMGVSKAALAIRLKRLGILHADYLKNPYDLVNIYPQKDESQFFEEVYHAKDQCKRRRS
ncbi:MAG: ImmA/IrrE family metallo-endopeptidase [Candidatus Gastranaerophilales bacterium]|nr:ImmA/IrrE family metallo-endopeptidase [Candidatus Gastranaerophilales bacterium]